MKSFTFWNRQGGNYLSGTLKKNKRNLFIISIGLLGELNTTKGILFIAFLKLEKHLNHSKRWRLKKNSKNAGFIIFDLRTRTSFGELLYEDTIDEIYDINIIEGAKKPGIITKLNKKHKNIIVTPNGVF